MGWVKPKGYSRSKVNWAGNILTDISNTEENINKAFEILENWRAIHSYPLHILKKRLKEKSEKIDSKTLTAQRLKRSSSILKKLRRAYNGKNPSMTLSQMQDIGGCRAVLKTMDLANNLINIYYLKGDLKHKRVRIKDYVKFPKADGYRSIHLVYKYFSDKKKYIYNDLLIEIQIRSKIQHLWATAIETVDFFTRQAIKSNKGQKEWLEFFRLVSSAFALLENCPLVPNTPTDEKELFLKIKKIEKELKIIKNLEQWAFAIKIIEPNKNKKDTFFLLELDISNERLIITSYTKNQEEKAIAQYSKSEKNNINNPNYDVVLVGIDNAKDLKKNYPNYFVDTKEFIKLLKEIINKY